jgi:hypothetical protein
VGRDFLVFWRLATVDSALRAGKLLHYAASNQVVGHERKDGEEAAHFYPRVTFMAAGTEWGARGRSGACGPSRRSGPA